MIVKHDQEKSKAIDFYWDGLKKIFNCPFFSQVVDDFLKFGHAPKIEVLRDLFVSTKQWCGPDYPEIINDTGYVYYHGAEKYGDKNYLGLPLERIIQAIGRHLRAIGFQEFYDKDSGYPHIAHLFANILIAAELLDG